MATQTTPQTEANRLLSKGDQVVTIHNEELTVLDVKKVPVKKHGEFTGEVTIMFLAKSGDTNCWFPESYVKEVTEDEEKEESE